MSPRNFDPSCLERVFVLGLGLSGTAAARLLRKRGIGVVASDRRSAAEIGADDLARDAGVELRLCDTSSELPSGLDAVVTSPGVGLDHPLLLRAAERGVPVVAEVELALTVLIFIHEEYQHVSQKSCDCVISCCCPKCNRLCLFKRQKACC